MKIKVLHRAIQPFVTFILCLIKYKHQQLSLNIVAYLHLLNGNIFSCVTNCFYFFFTFLALIGNFSFHTERAYYFALHYANRRYDLSNCN
jgi:hypothetical protein